MTTATRPRVLPATPAPASRGARTEAIEAYGLAPWLRAQSLNVTRHAAALRPFTRGEFGTGAAAPTEGHIQAVNRLLDELRPQLFRLTQEVTAAVPVAQRRESPRDLQRLVVLKERAHDRVRAIEQVWDFYFEFFGQRQSRFADWLLSCDRIALDCYQASFMGLPVPKSLPAPAPMTFMRTGFSPSTYRRGIPLRRIGRRPNPFPIVQLPYHRMVNPWTLGAVLHEVGHNLNNDLDLHVAVPAAIRSRLTEAGHPPAVVATWVRWNRETFADMVALLLGGPAVVLSLMDILARSPQSVLTYNPRAVHPLPYYRLLLSTILLSRLGFPDHARTIERSWRRLYHGRETDAPLALRRSFPDASAMVVDAMCFQRYPSLGGRALYEVVRFAPKDQHILDECARRLAAGVDPGIVPERFLIGASRVALDRELARPGVITRNFYRALSGR